MSWRILPSLPNRDPLLTALGQAWVSLIPERASGEGSLTVPEGQRVKGRDILKTTLQQKIYHQDGSSLL